jgi:antitoxin FitA
MFQRSVMTKMIPVRNVPENLHRELVQRARRRGLTLTDFIQQILEREVARPLLEDVMARLESRDPVEVDVPIAELIRTERESR